MSERVALCPGLEKPGQAEKAEKHLQDRNHADYQCYMLLRDLLDSAGGKSLRGAFYDPEKGAEWVERARDWVDNRQAANEAFLNAVAGR